MRIDIVARPDMAHQVENANALRCGLNRHGIGGEIIAWPTKSTSELVACWGWAIGAQLSDMGRDVLVMERGYIGDRTHWTSLGWNGLNGRARVPLAPADGGARFERNYSRLMHPYNPAGHYALIIGQVPGDASLQGLDLAPWYAHEAREAAKQWLMPVRFRPHPVALEQGYNQSVPGAETMIGPLAKALAGAAVVITWNSNTAVDAILAGKNTTAADKGSMAWEVSDREAWAHALAWRQFSQDELTSGFAWEHLRKAIP